MFLIQVYADLGVAEVWVYDGESLAIQQWQNGMCITSHQMGKLLPH